MHSYVTNSRCKRDLSYLFLIHGLDGPFHAGARVHGLMYDAEAAFAQFPAHSKLGFYHSLIVHADVRNW